ncbi:MAG TPA: Dam family site-specific DNA-(adenine-N6)-methyltransferase [Fimbriimonas sp.]|nr:Dam family site-specific DNA-(adenine-N6)-methyltransferase [Fimbriimonas sp.]
MRETPIKPDQAGQSCAPLVRWAGSKRQILKQLGSYWSSDFNTYHEPFCGSLSLYLSLSPSHARLSDLNSELIQTYKTTVRYHRAIGKVLASMEPNSDTYYETRRLFSAQSKKITRAAHFIYLNRLCFNGLYRTNLAGEFNVPYGGWKTPKLPGADHIRQFAKSLSRTILSCSDFEDALSFVNANDFVYLDPPYSVASVRTFKEYLPSGFAESDLIRLRKQLVRIDKLGAKFVLSYAETPEAAFLYEGFSHVTVPVKRLIAASTNARTNANEMIISNCKPRKESTE